MGSLEKGQIILAFPRDFTSIDPSAYIPSSEILFNDSGGPP
jgi:hypothetical protein